MTHHRLHKSRPHFQANRVSVTCHVVGHHPIKPFLELLVNQESAVSHLAQPANQVAVRDPILIRQSPGPILLFVLS